MKYIVSRYNQDVGWLENYSSDVILYDRSEMPLSPLPRYIKESTIVENKGTDIYDKFTYIIDNYNDLPDVAIYTKANLFKYITKEEFEKVKDNKTFTPLLTKDHKTYADEEGTPVCYYDNQGMFNETNNFWYLYPHPAKFAPIIIDFFNMKGRLYNQFAPGSNYILPKENILKHSKEDYEKLRACLDWDVYPGDAQLLERNLYYLWQ